MAQADERFEQSFAHEESGEPMLVLTSSDAAQYAQRTAAGYVFSLPAANAPISPAGLLARFRVRGDFQIVAGYEIVTSQPPTVGYGSGASLFISCDAGDGGTVARFDMPEIGPAIATDRMSSVGGHSVQTVPAHAAGGKLQLMREGAVLRYLAAEPGGDWREVRREEFVSADVTTVRLAADTGLSTVPLTVRFTDFQVRAAQLPLTSAIEDESRRRIAAWLLCGLFAAGACSAAAALARKRRHA